MIQATLQIPDYQSVSTQENKFVDDWLSLSKNVSQSWDNISVSDEMKYQRGLLQIYSKNE